MFSKKKKKKQSGEKCQGIKRPPVMNNKTVGLILQKGNDNEINNELITMHVTADWDDLYVLWGGQSLLHHGQAWWKRNEEFLSFNATCDNWASQSALRKCITLLGKHKLCGEHRLGSFSEFELKKSPVQYFELISIEGSARPLLHNPFKIQMSLPNRILNMINTTAGRVLSGNKSLWSLVIATDKRQSGDKYENGLCF